MRKLCRTYCLMQILGPESHLDTPTHKHLMARQNTLEKLTTNRKVCKKNDHHFLIFYIADLKAPYHWKILQY